MGEEYFVFFGVYIIWLVDFIMFVLEWIVYIKCCLVLFVVLYGVIVDYKCVDIFGKYWFISS